MDSLYENRKDMGNFCTHITRRILFYIEEVG